MSDRPLLYHTEAYEYLANDMIDLGDFERGELEHKRFPDGERYLRIVDQCSGRDVILLGGTISDEDTLQIFDLGCALSKYGARRLTLLIPFYGYSTMERAAKPGEVVGAKTRARLISSIPIAAVGNRVFLCDLHVSGITHYFEAGIRPVHIYAKEVVGDACRALGGDDFVLGCTDAGRAKWVESLASDLGVTAAFVYKRRLSGELTEVVGVSAHVEGKAVVIYDDMIRTGGSILGAAKAYREAGATSVAAVTTHGLFPNDALDRLRDSGLLDALISTDTHPRSHALAGDFLQVQSIAPTLINRLEVTP